MSVVTPKRVKPGSHSVPRSGVRELLLSMVIVILRHTGRCGVGVQCTMGATDCPQDPEAEPKGVCRTWRRVGAILQQDPAPAMVEAGVITS